MPFHIVKRAARHSIAPTGQARAYRVRVVAKAFSILNVPAASRSELGVAEFSEQVHLRQSALHRLPVLLKRSRNSLGKNCVSITVEGIDASANPRSPATSLCQGFNCMETLSIQAIQESQTVKGVVQVEYGRTLRTEYQQEHP